MATSTSNLGLQKPDYSDAADIAVLNGNSDKIDSSVNATDGAIAIVSNGNTHPAIPSGNYVYIRGHGSLSEGLYKNSTSGTIGVNATLSTSNVSAISSGGMNEMKSITDTLNSNMLSNVIMVSASVTLGQQSAGAYGNGTASITIPTGYKTIGICSASINQLYNARGLCITPIVDKDLSAGSQTVAYSYYTPKAITSDAASVFYINVLCVRV